MLMRRRLPLFICRHDAAAPYATAFSLPRLLFVIFRHYAAAGHFHAAYRLIS